jgi:hypothetical protein
VRDAAARLAFAALFGIAGPVVLLLSLAGCGSPASECGAYATGSPAYQACATAVSRRQDEELDRRRAAAGRSKE